MKGEESVCERCEGDGSYSRLADCTTYGPDCACNFERVIVDPCDVCGGADPFDGSVGVPATNLTKRGTE